MRGGTSSQITTTHTADSNNIYKKDNVVNLTISIVFKNNVTAWTIFANVPEGFRPKFTQYINALNNAGYIQITPEGAVQSNMARSTNDRLTFTGSYLIN